MKYEISGHFLMKLASCFQAFFADASSSDLTQF